MLLLSEREADSALECIFRLKHAGPAKSTSGSPPLLMILSYAAEAVATTQTIKLAVSMSKGGHFLLPPSLGPSTLPSSPPFIAALARLLLFDGECVYPSQALKKAVHVLVRRKKSEAEKIVAMRGRETMLSRSHLEQACEDVML